MPFHGYTQQQYACDMIKTFIRRGIDLKSLWPQSFNPPDIIQWLAEYHDFGKQAIYLYKSGETPANYSAAVARLPGIKTQGANIISPSFTYFLTLTPDNKTIVPSAYAKAVKEAGLDIITWTFERFGTLAGVAADNDYYYTSIASDMHYNGQLDEILDVLRRQTGIEAIFTDWASTAPYFANHFSFTGPVATNYK
jgi:glycerophosphoryl diester phosphodiesterase